MEHLLTPDDLAAVLGIKTRSLYVGRYMGRNLPPAIKVGRCLRFRPADVQAWLASQPASSRNVARASVLATKRNGEQIHPRKTSSAATC